MKSWHVMVIIALAIFLAGCSQGEYTFRQGFEDMKKIDNRYDINFHKEKLNGTMVNLELVNDVLQDLESLQRKVQQKKGPEVQDVVGLLEARMEMIESQRYWILAKMIGPRGVTRDGFACSDAPYVREASLYYAQSWQHAIDAQRILDEILARNQATWEIIGTDQEKPDFYRSRLDYISDDVQFNAQNMLDACKIQI